MVFEEIVLNNFGIYKGSHLIQLTPPSSQQPIILLGGLNGSGKTTFLDALQLTLYGKFAKCSSRGNINYVDYLRRMINHHADPTQGASLELQFKHFKAAEEQSIRIRRFWYVTGKSVKETIEVKRNGILDMNITERWYEYVEEFIPARISSLFFFDGEKIEAFADTSKAGELFKTGIYALLGLDIVDRLDNDLGMVERKRKMQLQSQQASATLLQLEDEMRQLEKEDTALVEQKTDAVDRLAQLNAEQEQLNNAYRREGGELFDQRRAIEAQLEAARKKRSKVEDQLRDLAATEIPLMLVQDFLRKTEKQALREQEAKRNREMHDELEKRDTALLQLLKKQAVKSTALSAVEKFIQADQQQREQSLETECYLNIETKAFALLQDSFLSQIQNSANTLIVETEEFIEEINQCEQQLAGIPDPERLEGITAQLKSLKKDITQSKVEIESIEQQYARISHKIERKNTELKHAYETEAQEQFANEVTHRVLKHALKVHRTLEKFKQAMTQKHIRHLEFLILEGFQQLIRKEEFITRLEIDPDSYTLRLYTPTHETLYPENLSAGERQLLAVSILWGLSRASGRPLPAIIDTPLSRLDGQHRNNLVENYFPSASHQVILLSTDEEINQKYYSYLKPAIGREYHIAFEKKQQSSVIKQGYFFK
ncbi:MAG TPA: DNA sulfur modification protein DndD [Thiotrichaceae bacterium]|nr:DNA sulfur modification protein DndD [Thiotrichaceae bacterium]